MGMKVERDHRPQHVPRQASAISRPRTPAGRSPPAASPTFRDPRRLGHHRRAEQRPPGIRCPARKDEEQRIITRALVRSPEFVGQERGDNCLPDHAGSGCRPGKRPRGWGARNHLVPARWRPPGGDDRRNRGRIADRSLGLGPSGSTPVTSGIPAITARQRGSPSPPEPHDPGGRPVPVCRFSRVSNASSRWRDSHPVGEALASSRLWVQTTMVRPSVLSRAMSSRTSSADLDQARGLVQEEHSRFVKQRPDDGEPRFSAFENDPTGLSRCSHRSKAQAAARIRRLASGDRRVARSSDCRARPPVIESRRLSESARAPEPPSRRVVAESGMPATIAVPPSA
jgi:hypothetical protein